MSFCWHWDLCALHTRRGYFLEHQLIKTYDMYCHAITTSNTLYTGVNLKLFAAGFSKFPSPKLCFRYCSILSILSYIVFYCSPTTKQYWSPVRIYVLHGILFIISHYLVKFRINPNFPVDNIPCYTRSDAECLRVNISNCGSPSPPAMANCSRQPLLTQNFINWPLCVQFHNKSDNRVNWKSAYHYCALPIQKMGV